MNGIMKRNKYETYYENTDDQLMPDGCNFSGYSMAAMAGGILLCLGIILYAILTV